MHRLLGKHALRQEFSHVQRCDSPCKMQTLQETDPVVHRTPPHPPSKSKSEERNKMSSCWRSAIDSSL
eukprot:scaffold7783_cov85-Skeletonema_dohrnii-CCMP3373.AAC.9